jgi:hypothetical protein
MNRALVKVKFLAELGDTQIALRSAEGIQDSNRSVH